MAKADEGDFSVHIRIDTKTLVIEMQKRIDGFAKKMLNDDMKFMAAEMYHDYVEKYVPHSTGNLRDSVDYVKYKGAYAIMYDPVDKYGHHYAAAQYYGNNGSKWPESLWERKDKNTHSYWNRHITTAERKAMYDDIADLIASELNNKS